MTTISPALRGVCLLVSVLPLAGCGPSTGEIEGTVEYDGKPLTSGSVIFMSEDKKPRLAHIHKDGTYRISDCPPGLVRIAVRTRPREPEAFSHTKPPPKSTIPADYLKGGVAIPRKYEEAEQSGLTYQVKLGRQTHNLKLTSAAKTK